MKIIKEGNLECLKAKKRFACPDCGCIFEATKDEYYGVELQLDQATACPCPYCGREVFWTKPLEHSFQGYQ